MLSKLNRSGVKAHSAGLVSQINSAAHPVIQKRAVRRDPPEKLKKGSVSVSLSPGFTTQSTTED